MIPPKGRAEVDAMFGPILYGPDGRPSRTWERETLAIVPLPYPLENECGAPGAPTVKRLYCHRLLAERFVQVFEQIQAAGLERYARKYAGCYCHRFISGTRKLSYHSYAIAIDLNAKKNPVGAPPRQHPSVVEIFADHGFRWGGTWKRPDAMHFEFVR